jgi:molybdopterin-guanine dinucleotide biosynthesis protein A
MGGEQIVVIVLCGGTSRRMAGRDKTRELLAGTTVLDHLLNGLPPNWGVVCVGDERATTRSVQWCREFPAGGGPVAGIAAGLDHVDHVDGEHRQRDKAAEICVVVGGDMPFAAAALSTLVDALTAQPGLDAVLACDPDGRTQPLLAAYRSEALRAALPREPGGVRLMAVVESLRIETMACEARTTLDVDTPEALERARLIVGT